MTAISNMCIVLYLPEDTKPGYVLEVARKLEEAEAVQVPGKGQTLDIVGVNIMGVTAVAENTDEG